MSELGDLAGLGPLGNLEEVTTEGNTTRLVLQRPSGQNLVIQITNDSDAKSKKTQKSIEQLLAASNVGSSDGTSSSKGSGKKTTLFKERGETNMTPLMKAAKSKDGVLVRKEIIQLKKKNNKNDGGGASTLETLLNEQEKFEEYTPGDDGKGKTEEGSHVKDGNVSEGADESKAPLKAEEEASNKPSAEEKSNPNAMSTNKQGGWTAVHYACEYANPDGLRYLLDAGADPNLTERMGATPLHRVILAAGRYPLQQRLLLAQSADGKQSSDEKKKSLDVGHSQGGSRATLPGVVKDKAGVQLKGGEGDKYLEDFIKCAQTLLNCPRFNLLMNERREDEWNAANRSNGGTAAKKKGKNDTAWKYLPKNDGYGFSPLCLCVCQGYTSRDQLYPLLEMFLTRGFDPNANMCGISALQIALRNAHYGCAFALTRAGANVNAPHPDDGKTPLQVAELIFGDAFARELREASVVALAVADPTRRRDLLRSQGAEGAKKLAKRAMNAGHSFIKASRWREAAGAYTEAALYGKDSLGMYERFECLRNMSECYLQVERGMKAEEVARTLLKEYPRNPLAMVAVGEALSHPSCGKLSPEQLKEVNKLADDALNLEKKTDGKEWWRTIEPKSNSTLFRILKLKSLVEGKKKEDKNPAVNFANTALDEYFSSGGSIEKAAFAIELALKPELKHPSPLPLHGIRGFIYYSWASEILRANSLCRVDRERKEGFQRVMAPLKNKMSYKEALEKIRNAYDEFEYYNKKNNKGEFPRLMYGFNISKTTFALGMFEKGKKSALASIKERAEAE